MKSVSLTVWIASAIMLVGIYGCSKDPARPVINDFEIGKDNSGVAVRGGGLHIEANMEAEGKIDVVIVEIHFEGVGEGWEYEKIYTEFNGLKNGEFHNHIEVPADAALGEYHVDFKVRDQEGQETKVAGDVEILEQ